MSKFGRNDLCPCGSGEKYKKCCISVDNQYFPEPFIDDHGINYLLPGTPPTSKEIEEATKRYAGKLWIGKRLKVISKTNTK